MEPFYAIGMTHPPLPAVRPKGVMANDLSQDGTAMQTYQTPAQAAEQSAYLAERLIGEALPPSVEVRCGAAETAAIIRLLDHLGAAREAVQAWDGVTRDPYQRARQKYARLLADLFQRYPDEVLAGLRSPHAHTRIWIALAIAEGPSPRAIPALEQALAVELNELDRKALSSALQACLARC